MITVVLWCSLGQDALAFCPQGEACREEYEVAVSLVRPSVIAYIQALYKGRVVSIQAANGGNAQIQLITQKNQVIIVTVDRQGNIIGVQE